MRRFFGILAAIMPWAIIIALGAVGFLYHPVPRVQILPEPPIGTRDFYYGVAVPDDNVVWLAGSWGKIVRSEDNGASWTIQTAPTVEHLQDIYAWDKSHAVAVGNAGVVLRTEDGGKTWVEVQNVPKSADRNKLTRVRGLPDGRAWAIGLQNAIIYTADYGATWKRSSKDEDRVLTDIGFAGSRLVIVGEFGRTKISDDGGVTWRDGQAPVTASLNGVKFRDAKRGIAVGQEGDVVVTEDGGDSWSHQTPVVDKHLYDAAWTGKDWIAVGDKGRYVRGDGSNWKGGRFSITDLGWHVKTVVRGTKIYLAGNSVGYWDDADGTYHLWGQDHASSDSESAPKPAEASPSSSTSGAQTSEGSKGQ